MLLAGGALQQIIKVFERTTNKTVQYTTAWAMSNLCRGNFKIIQ
jgi:hypothetical protein